MNFEKYNLTESNRTQHNKWLRLFLLIWNYLNTMAPNVDQEFKILFNIRK